MGSTFLLRRVPLWRRWGARPRTCTVRKRVRAMTFNGFRRAFCYALTSPPISLTSNPRCGSWGWLPGGIAAFGPARRVPSYRDFYEGVACSTWKATLTEELPPSLVARICGSAWLALCWLLGTVGSGDRRLLEVLHLCLVKRLPRCCLKKRRLILLEPYIFMLQSGLVFLCMRFIPEATGWKVVSSFAYRAALSRVLCALPCRWRVAFWLTRHSHPYVGDWDEKDAFCNTVRPGLGVVCSFLGMLGIAVWAEEFLGRFRVWVVTPFGLGRPYRMAHWGAQGESTGVSLYGCMGGACSSFNQGVVDAAVDSSTFLLVASPSDLLWLRAP